MSVMEAARDLVLDPDYRYAPWGGWDYPERIGPVPLYTIDRHRRGEARGVGAREQALLFAQVAALAGSSGPREPGGAAGGRGARSASPPCPVRARGRGAAPVVMLVFDEFPAISLLDARGRIGAERYPNFAAFTRTGTWFPYATASVDETGSATGRC